jgi:hypothetical protein
VKIRLNLDRKTLKAKALPTAIRLGKFLLKSKLLMALMVLFTLGFTTGMLARPDHDQLPYEELFESMSVLSYREAPSDSNARFIVELSAKGKVFRQYDVDERRFLPPARGHDYARAISGTRYQALSVRGHVDRGCWLELPDSITMTLVPDQFDELYRSTVGFVKPLSVATVIIGTVSGVSIGYRAATWSNSLSNPAVQKRILATPGIGRVIAREAWRRVLLEPVMMGHENDANRFASAQGMQRIYTNFFKVALNDSDQFIPWETDRLDALGRHREANMMRAFARAVQRAEQDTCNLKSEDFRAIEDWASLLDRRGHWARGTVPWQKSERMRYYGTLAWFGLAPSPKEEQRIWVGPRLLVRDGDSEGFISDEIPSMRVGCPVAWREWLKKDPTGMSQNAWTAQWMRESRQLAQVVDIGRDVARRWQETQ